MTENNTNYILDNFSCQLLETGLWIADHLKKEEKEERIHALIWIADFYKKFKQQDYAL